MGLGSQEDTYVKSRIKSNILYQLYNELQPTREQFSYRSTELNYLIAPTYAESFFAPSIPGQSSFSYSYYNQTEILDLKHSNSYTLNQYLILPRTKL